MIQLGKSSRKYLIFDFIFHLLNDFLIAFGIIGGSGDEAIAVNVGTCERGALQQTVSVRSTIMGSDQADVYSVSSNRIASILVNEGDIVSEGQVLAKLEAGNSSNGRAQLSLAASDAKRNYESMKQLYEAGVSAKANIITGSVDNALIVPIDSIFEDPDSGKTYVFTVTDGILEKHEVEIILEGNFKTAISDGFGIGEGDSVVLSPDFTMVDGMQVLVTE